MTSRASGTSIIAAGILFVSSLAQAGDGDTPGWVNTLKNMGKVYSNEENPVVQSVKIFGRVHGQWNYSDGDSAGESE